MIAIFVSLEERERERERESVYEFLGITEMEEWEHSISLKTGRFAVYDSVWRLNTQLTAFASKPVHQIIWQSLDQCVHQLWYVSSFYSNHCHQWYYSMDWSDADSISISYTTIHHFFIIALSVRSTAQHRHRGKYGSHL